MKWNLDKLPDELDGMVLVEHADYGLMLCTWHGGRKTPGYDAVGFRPGVHEGQSHPLVATPITNGDRVNAWVRVEPVS